MGEAVVRITFTILTILFCASLLVAQEPQPEKTATQLATIEPMAQAIRDYGQSPTDFIVEKFDHHDIVLLGEIHQVKENCEFVASLIEPLNKRGVKRLCSEFTPSRLNPELHRIITDKTYDESAVVDLFRLGPWPSWGYQEYMDIVRAAWQVNQNLKSDEAPFLIMGIDSDWTQVKQMKADRQARFKMLVNRESHMTESILNASIEAQEKALVHIGLAHTVKHGIRVANELDKLEQAKVFQVLLHHEIRSPSGISPIPGQIEKAAELSTATSIRNRDCKNSAPRSAARLIALCQKFRRLRTRLHLAQTD